MRARTIARLALVLFGVGVALIGCELALRLAPPRGLFYRPHEMLVRFDPALGHRVYRRGARIEMIEPYGDMIALGGRAARATIEAEPRRVRFAVDSYGFRNDHEYRHQPFVLTGDSFVVGIGNSQEDILSNQIDRECGIAAYNVAFPGDIHDYATYVSTFVKRRGGDFKVVMFAFEGNDFPTEEEATPVPVPQDGPFVRFLRDPLKRVRESRVSETMTYRSAYLAYQIALKQFRGGAEPAAVVSVDVRGHRLGMFARDVEASRRARYAGTRQIEADLAAMRDRLALLVFIPTKYRVYYPFLDGAAREPLPSPVSDYVRELGTRLGIQTADLTDALVTEAGRVLARDGTFVYWKDDTHWNKQGIGVAAREVCRALTPTRASR